MSKSPWSEDFYKARVADKKVKKIDTFKYDTDTKVKPVNSWKVHEKLDPKGVIRESRDSEVNPESLAIMILFDVTGSMNTIPRALQVNLPKLMSLLIQKGVVQYPQICFGAIGDATYDKVPLQIGQFECGNEMEDDLENVFLEGGGGSEMTESYELGIYFASRHTSIDCYEKRGQKGYLFIIGDEAPYKQAKKDEVEILIGDKLQSNISIKDIVEECSEKYYIFHLRATNGNCGRNEWVNKEWKEILPQTVIPMSDSEAICELIASTIGVNEGKLDLNGALRNIDNDKAKEVVSSALSTYVKRTSTSLVGSVSGGLVSSDSGKATLL